MRQTHSDIKVGIGLGGLIDPHLGFKLHKTIPSSVFITSAGNSSDQSYDPSSLEMIQNDDYRVYHHKQCSASRGGGRVYLILLSYINTHSVSHYIPVTENRVSALKMV